MHRTLFLLILLVPAAAFARRGVVLRVEAEGAQVYVDQGAADGLKAGSVVVLHHAIEAVHPVNGKKVRDTFPLGRMQVTKAGEHLALLAAPFDLGPRVAVGDEIELVGEAAPVRDPWLVRVEERAAAARAAVEDPEVARREREREAAEAAVTAETAAREVWDQTLGQPPERRIELWTAYLGRFPSGPLAGAVHVEIDRLRAEKKAEDELTAGAAKRREAQGAAGALPPYQLESGVIIAGPLAYAPALRATEAEPLELAFLAPKPGSLRGAWLHYRRAGDATYRRASLEPAGDGALRAVIPPDAVKTPAVQYFVEVLEPDAASPRAVVGRADSPAAIHVETRPAEPPPDVVGRSRVTLIVDYVDFDNRTGLDHYLQAEADFMYRFRSPVYSMRLGVAGMTGQGGPTEVIDSAYAMNRPECTDATGAYRCTRVAFNYVYAELELHPAEVVAVMVRPLFGRGHTDGSPVDNQHEFRDSAGVRLRLRLGRETETNLALGTSLVSGFGTLYEAVFTWDVIPRFPVVLSAQVTDQPVPGDFGVRLIADVGWRGLKWMYPSVRVSYQARNIDHAGVSAGGAINFDW